MKQIVHRRSLTYLTLLTGFTLIIGGQGVYSSGMSPTSSQRCEKTHQYIAPKSGNAPSNSWRGLVPLQSTRFDVEQLLGKAKWSHGSTFLYETPCGRVDVLYSRGVCELSDVERWNVPADVMIRMEIAPGRKLLVRDLNLKANRYLRQRESHPEHWVRYQSDEDGIRVDALVGKKAETVRVITYKPTKNDDALRCSATVNSGGSERRDPLSF